MNPGSSGYRLGEVQRKRGRKTDYNDEDKDERKDREGTMTTLQKMKARHRERLPRDSFRQVTGSSNTQEMGAEAKKAGLQMDQMPRTRPCSRINSSKGDN